MKWGTISGDITKWENMLVVIRDLVTIGLGRVQEFDYGFGIVQGVGGKIGVYGLGFDLGFDFGLSRLNRNSIGSSYKRGNVRLVLIGRGGFRIGAKVGCETALFGVVDTISSYAIEEDSELSFS